MSDAEQSSERYIPDWSDAPAGWNWAAQDEDGRWFWYQTEPVLGIGGGVWRANSRAQRLAGSGLPNPLWYESLLKRPGSTQAASLHPAAPDPA